MDYASLIHSTSCITPGKLSAPRGVAKRCTWSSKALAMPHASWFEAADVEGADRLGGRQPGVKPQNRCRQDSRAAFYKFRNNRIIQVICPTCQMSSRDCACLRPPGYFAWGCFRYFSCEGRVGLAAGLPSCSSRPRPPSPTSASRCQLRRDSLHSLRQLVSALGLEPATP